MVILFVLHREYICNKKNGENLIQHPTRGNFQKTPGNSQNMSVHKQLLMQITYTQTCVVFLQLQNHRVLKNFKNRVKVLIHMEKMVEFYISKSFE